MKPTDEEIITIGKSFYSEFSRTGGMPHSSRPHREALELVERQEWRDNMGTSLHYGFHGKDKRSRVSTFRIG